MGWYYEKILLALDGSAAQRSVWRCAQSWQAFTRQASAPACDPLLDENIHYGLPESGLSPALEARPDDMKEAEAFSRKKASRRLS